MNKIQAEFQHFLQNNKELLNREDFSEIKEETSSTVNQFLEKTFGRPFSTFLPTWQMTKILSEMKSSEEWTRNFCNVGGLQFVLNMIYDSDDDFYELHSTCFEIIRIMLLNETVMEQYVQMSDLFAECLIKLYKSRDEAIKVDIIGVLAAIANQCEEGFWIVMQVISTYDPIYKHRFNALISNLTRSESSDAYKLNILTMLNAVIHVPEEADLKRYLVNEMEDSALLETLDKLKHENLSESIATSVQFLEEQIDKLDEQELDSSQSRDLLIMFKIARIQLPTASAYTSFRSILNSILNALHNTEKREYNLSLLASILNKCVSMDGTVTDVLKQLSTRNSLIEEQTKKIKKLQESLPNTTNATPIKSPKYSDNNLAIQKEKNQEKKGHLGKFVKNVMFIGMAVVPIAVGAFLLGRVHGLRSRN